jgi:hypothetical protein
MSARSQLLWIGGWFKVRVEKRMSDDDIQQMESRFPAVSSSAFAAARERVLASGQSVLESENGVIYEVFPDGRRVEVKKVEPPTQYASGSVFTIR